MHHCQVGCLLNALKAVIYNNDQVNWYFFGFQENCLKYRNGKYTHPKQEVWPHTNLDAFWFLVQFLKIIHTHTQTNIYKKQ